MLYIGIDLGTSAVKLLLMKENGSIQNIVSKEYPIYFPKTGWAEQNPEDWYEKTVEGIKELTQECDKSQIKGISFGGQMHGLVILDERDCVIRPAILWNDGRTKKQTNYLNEEIGRNALVQYTGNIAFAGFTAPKLLWLQHKEPDNFKRIAKLMLPKDYLVYCLCGVHSTDYSDASGTLLLDVEHKCWSEKMLDICKITTKVLPKLYESYEVVGTIKKEVGAELGLGPDVKIIAGAGDNAAGAVGCGAVGENKCNISVGTSGTIFLSAKTFYEDRGNALHSFAHADGNYHLMGCMLSAASCNKWWMEEILHTKDYQAQQRTIQKLGENSVYFLPYLMGERAVHNNPDARGMFIGLGLDTSREEMTQAVLEGGAFGLRDSLEAMKQLGVELKSATLCGGGGKSLLWKKILANVLNLELQTLECEQGPAYGSAILAAVGCKEYESVEQATKTLVKVKESISPETELTEKYNQCYEKFKSIYPAVKELFSELLL